MQKRQLDSTICIFLSIALLLGSAISCILTEKEEKTNIFYHYYRVEPESLLRAIQEGNADAFTPVLEEPASLPTNQQMPVTWTQQDYLQIANALTRYIWNESLDEWRLNKMSFSLGCEEYGTGFQAGNFEFFRVVKAGNRENRLSLIINIRPRGEYVFITKNEYFPRLFDWASIDLEKNKLSASDILLIAENAGAAEKRLSVHDACGISIWLSPDSASYHGWRVHYYQRDDQTTLFEVNIDPVTGNIHLP